MEPVSRENEPSAFAWVFGGVMAAVALAGGAWAALRRRSDRQTRAADDAGPGNR